MDTYEVMHGFSGVFAVSGTLLNSDAGLAAVHETKNAVGVRLRLSVSPTMMLRIVVLQFFKVPCRASANVVLSHLKAHV